jgi:phage replication O-like protein O
MKMKTNTKTPQTDKGFIQIACGSQDNDILLALSGFGLTGTELSIILVIIRKTWGWKKKEDYISLSQFEELCNVTRRSIIKSTRSLEDKNIIIRKRFDGKKSLYSFNKNFSTWLNKPTTREQKCLGNRSSHTREQKCTKLGNASIHTKETIQKKLLQKKYSSIKNLTENDLKEIANDYNVPVSFVYSQLDTMKNWMSAKGKRYKNYKSALRNWVKKGAIQRMDYAKQANSKRGIDLSNL